ncbi:uncharacterized mitochondrial protein AtMg00810-like [Solanum tuberosum]|uniref:uncharacterized mitochondrial protein AtMg00810-like n=1 Tax=Solanum tuberosum TaxID=4113 RepID=UPI00073A2C40|nr:PREDICTED: uncharacterized mitochondrial protein AtMg00810-like [Solanum tuberosum]
MVYVDDLILIGNDHSMIQHTKETLHTTFKIKDFGELKYFLGIEFARSNRGILMHQRKYALELIADMRLAGAKTITIPMVSSNSEDLVLEDPTGYHKLIGTLLYLTTTRSDQTLLLLCKV